MHPKSRGQYFFPYIFKTVFLWHRLWSINRTRRDKRTGRDLDLLAMANCQQYSSIIIEDQLKSSRVRTYPSTLTAPASFLSESLCMRLIYPVCRKKDGMRLGEASGSEVRSGWIT